MGPGCRRETLSLGLNLVGHSALDSAAGASPAPANAAPRSRRRKRGTASIALSGQEALPHSFVQHQPGWPERLGRIPCYSRPPSSTIRRGPAAVFRHSRTCRQLPDRDVPGLRQRSWRPCADRPGTLPLPETSSALVGAVLRVSRNLAAVARVRALAQLPSARHDDRSCCCDWLTWV